MCSLGSLAPRRFRIYNGAEIHALECVERAYVVRTHDTEPDHYTAQITCSRLVHERAG
jgi:hypothetical protein